MYLRRSSALIDYLLTNCLFVQPINLSEKKGIATDVFNRQQKLQFMHHLSGIRWCFDHVEEKLGHSITNCIKLGHC